MIVVPASFKIEERNEIRGGIENIELAGRTCYKSEDKAKLGNGDKFVTNLIKHHHEAMLEHGDYIFMVKDAHIWEYIKNSLSLPGARPFMLNMTVMGDRRIISGNIRAWREFIRNRAAGAYFSGSIDPLYTADIAEDTKDWFEHTPDGRVERIFYNDLLYDKEQLAHLRQTVRFTVDRGVSHEIVRHRLFSFAQESTRYCNYAMDKFGNQITCIKPCYLTEGTEEYDVWVTAMEFAESAYFCMLDKGRIPQEARAVLPTSLKTELVVTGNLAEWKHFFDLRAKQVTGAAHPQMVEVAVPLWEEMARQYTVLV